jgi:hypothetical protein
MSIEPQYVMTAVGEAGTPEAPGPTYGDASHGHTARRGSRINPAELPDTDGRSKQPTTVGWNRFDRTALTPVLYELAGSPDRTRSGGRPAHVDARQASVRPGDPRGASNPFSESTRSHHPHAAGARPGHRRAPRCSIGCRSFGGETSRPDRAPGRPSCGSSAQSPIQPAP